MEKDLVLGYDFGTSALKAVLVGRDQKTIASGMAPYPLLLPRPGWAEQRPDDWWAAMCAVTSRLLSHAQADPARIAALALSAQMCGVVPVDGEGAPLSHAMLWLDVRSEAIARRLMGGIVRVSGYGVLSLLRWLWLTNGAPNLSGKDPPSKFLWLKQHEPSIWKRTHKLLDVKDYLVHRLTGRFVTSFDCAHLTWLFDARPGRRRWSDALIRRVGIEPGLLPDARRATAAVAGLRKDAAQALGLVPGIPVSVGCGDVFAAALGTGTGRSGMTHLYVGTGAWLGALIARAKVSPLTAIGSLSGADGSDHLLIAAQESGGACVRWGMRALGFEEGGFGAFEAAAARAQASAHAPMFFPWLCGERVPVDDASARGGFANLSINHRREDMARAIYEGVALNARWAMGGFDDLAGMRLTPLRIAGGGARSDLWCQIFADVLGRAVERIESPDYAGAAGSAMIAAVTAGWHDHLAAVAKAVRVERTFAPNPAWSALYAERFAHFAKGYRRLRGLYREAAKTLSRKTERDVG